MKIRDRICDVCGESIYKHSPYAYTIRRRVWRIERFGKPLDLCDGCWKRFNAWMKEETKNEL